MLKIVEARKVVGWARGNCKMYRCPYNVGLKKWWLIHSGDTLHGDIYERDALIVMLLFKMSPEPYYYPYMLIAIFLQGFVYDIKHPKL